MINRFKFHSENEGRHIHCIILEVPRNRVTRIPVISAGGKLYRVPVDMLVNVPEGSPIDQEKAIELCEKGQKHIMTKREQALISKQRRESVDRMLGNLLGFCF